MPEDDIPIPIMLNCWKHHARFINSKIKLVKNEESFLNLLKGLLLIGSSQMDLYLGSFSPQKIATEVIKLLSSSDVLEYPEYKSWLTAHQNYRKVIISDDSSWTLRPGNEKERYIHIHPSRYSVHSIRVKAPTLKTSIVFLAWKEFNGIKDFNMELINYLRKSFISESPLKSLEASEGILKMISILQREASSSE